MDDEPETKGDLPRLFLLLESTDSMDDERDINGRDIKGGLPELFLLPESMDDE